MAISDETISEAISVVDHINNSTDQSAAYLVLIEYLCRFIRLKKHRHVRVDRVEIIQTAKDIIDASLDGLS